MKNSGGQKNWINPALIFIFVCLLDVLPSCANEILKTRALVNSEFSIQNAPKMVELITIEPVQIKEDKTKEKNTVIPAGAAIICETYNYQRELRWHKSGYFICRPKNFTTEEGSKVNIEEKLYLKAKKYEKINGKEAAITGTELVLGTAASFFAPGVDIAYFFTKGAIQRKKNKNWFKAGVSNAYENSICWFWLKGKPIELTEGDFVDIKEITGKKANKLDKKINKRREKENLKAAKKEEKGQEKIVKEEMKKEKLNEKKMKEIAKKEGKKKKENFAKDNLKETHSAAAKIEVEN